MPKTKMKKKQAKRGTVRAPQPTPRSAAPARQAPFRARHQHINTRGNIVTIEHSEIVSPVLASGTAYAYALDALSLNPASATYPWLQGVSRIYDQYRVKRLTLRFVSNARTTRDGTVAMGVDFDATDAAPTSITDLLRLRDAKAGQVHQPMELHVQLGEQANNWYYTAEAPSTADRLSDVGVVFIASQGIDTASFMAGYLELHYVYEFRMPELLTIDVTQPAEYSLFFPRGTVSGDDIYRSDGATPVTDTSGVNGTLPVLVDSALKRVVPNPTNSMIRLPAGKWRVHLGFAPESPSTWLPTEVRTLVPEWVDALTGVLINPETTDITTDGKHLDATGSVLNAIYREMYVTLNRTAYLYAKNALNGAASTVFGGFTSATISRAMQPILAPPVSAMYGRFDTAPATCVKEKAQAYAASGNKCHECP